MGSTFTLWLPATPEAPSEYATATGTTRSRQTPRAQSRTLRPGPDSPGPHLDDAAVPVSVPTPPSPPGCATRLRRLPMARLPRVRPPENSLRWPGRDSLPGAAMLRTLSPRRSVISAPWLPGPTVAGGQAAVGAIELDQSPGTWLCTNESCSCTTRPPVKHDKAHDLFYHRRRTRRRAVLCAVRIGLAHLQMQQKAQQVHVVQRAIPQYAATLVLQPPRLALQRADSSCCECAHPVTRRCRRPAAPHGLRARPRPRARCNSAPAPARGSVPSAPVAPPPPGSTPAAVHRVHACALCRAAATVSAWWRG